MKVLVGVKRVLDPQVKARVMADGLGIDLNNAKMSMNPFDENAVEEAIRLKEAGQVDEIVTVSIGAEKSQETLRQTLAMGADRSIHVITDQVLEPLAIAKVLKHLVDREKPGLVLVGKQAIDDDSNQTGQMLSAMLDWAQSTFTSELSLNDDSAEVTREIDGGLEKITVNMPAVITVDLRLNEPRYASLPNVMSAKKKPLEKLALDDLDLDVSPRLAILEVMEPDKRAEGIRVESIVELIDKLRTEARVI